MAAEPGSQILSHLPMLFLMGLAIWYLRSAASSASAPPDATMQELCEQQVAEMRRMNAMLEGMAVVETRP